MFRKRTSADKISCFFRCIFCVLLILGVYTETGIWTSIAVSLTFIWSEAETYNRERGRS